MRKIVLSTILVLTCMFQLQAEELFCGCAPEEHALQVADISVRAKIMESECRKHNSSLETCYTVEVLEVLRGQAENPVFVTRGGQLGEELLLSSDSLFVNVGEEYRLHAVQREDGAYVLISVSQEDQEQVNQAESGGTGSVVTTSGYLENNGVPIRHLAADQNESIHYVIDAETFPSSVTKQGAIELVHQAFAAYAAESSLMFTYDGEVTLGFAASDNQIPRDGRIYVQLHDTYNAVGSAIGIGGGFSTIPGVAPNGGGGAIVKGVAFHRMTVGYVVLDHTASAFDNILTLGETITHEIGHSLGLAHSSNDPQEMDAVLRDAVMYFRIVDAGDGVGLEDYDKDCIKVAYPTDNTPPYAHEILMRAITPDTDIDGSNTSTITMGDRDTPFDQLTIENVPLIPSISSGSGTSTIVGSTVRYETPFFSSTTSTQQQIENGAFFHIMTFRIGDGVNFSPLYRFRVHAYERDFTPGDGIWSEWSSDHFGTTSSVGPLAGPLADPDGDGIHNRREYQLGTDPTVRNDFSVELDSNGSVSFDTVVNASYNLQSSTDLMNWKVIRSGMNEDTTMNVSGVIDFSEQQTFYRVGLAP